MAAIEMPTSAVEQMKAEALIAILALAFDMMLVEKDAGLRSPHRATPYTSDQTTVFEYASYAKDQ